jgi:hypothetical protein
MGMREPGTFSLACYGEVFVEIDGSSFPVQKMLAPYILLKLIFLFLE